MLDIVGQCVVKGAVHSVVEAPASVFDHDVARTHDVVIVAQATGQGVGPRVGVTVDGVVLGAAGAADGGAAGEHQLLDIG